MVPEAIPASSTTPSPPTFFAPATHGTTQSPKLPAVYTAKPPKGSSGTGMGAGYGHGCGGFTVQ